MMLTGIRQMEMKEVPTPVILNDRDVRIKMKTLGVCGSDIHYYVSGKIGSQVVEYPFAVGHEGAGTVEAMERRPLPPTPRERGIHGSHRLSMRQRRSARNLSPVSLATEPFIRPLRRAAAARPPRP